MERWWDHRVVMVYVCTLSSRSFLLHAKSGKRCVLDPREGKVQAARDARFVTTPSASAAARVLSAWYK